MNAQTPVLPNFNRQSGSAYKGRIDAAAALHDPVAGSFQAFASVQFDFVPGDVSAAANTLVQAGQVLFDDDVVRFTSTDTLPDPLAEDTDYHIVGADDESYQVSATEGGAAIDLTDAGAGIHTVELTEGLTIRVSAGFLQNGKVLTQVAAQISSALTAPSGDPRIDLVYVDARTGALGIATGSENASPVAPALPDGKIARAFLGWAVDQTEIVNADLRPCVPAPLPFNVLAFEAATPDTSEDLIAFLDATDGKWKQALLPPSEDQVARDAALIALIEATATGGVRGDVVSWVADSDNFTTKTGATFSTDHYHNPAGQTQISDGAGTVIGDATNGSYAFNGTTSQAMASCASKSGSPVYIGKDWGSGVTRTITGFQVWGSSDGGFENPGGDNNVTITLLGNSSNDTGTATSLGSVGPTTDSNGLMMEKLSGLTTSTAYRYHWLKIEPNVPTADVTYCAQIRFLENSSPADMLLSDDAVTIAADADTVDVYVTEKAVDASPTREIKASIDGGSTYSAAGTLQKSFVLGDRQIYRYSCDVSAQTGSSLKVTYDSLDDAKEREVYRLDALPIWP